MKLVIAATGASGTIYLQRPPEQIDCVAHEVHLITSAYAREVVAGGAGRVQSAGGAATSRR